MLKPLRSAVDTWRPTSRGVSPIDAVRGAWPSIVGADIAKGAMPREIQGDTLLITTKSGAWSQQLTFLESTILSALAEIPAARGLLKLRFRVGKVAESGTLKVSNAASARPKRRGTASPANATLEQILARLQIRTASFAKASANEPHCATCGIVIPVGNRCAPCHARDAQTRVVTVLRELDAAPWLSFQDIVQTINGLKIEEYEAARNDLRRRWWAILERYRRTKRLSRDERERAIAVSYVMLESGVLPARISRPIARNILGPELDALLYGAPT